MASQEEDIITSFHTEIGSIDPQSIVDTALSLTIGTTPVVAVASRQSPTDVQEAFASSEQTPTTVDTDDIARSVADNTQYLHEMDERMGILGRRIDRVDDSELMTVKEITNMRTEISSVRDEMEQLKGRFSHDLDTAVMNLSNQISALRRLILHNRTQDARTIPAEQHSETTTDKGKESNKYPVESPDVSIPSEEDMTTRIEQERLLSEIARRNEAKKRDPVASTSRTQLEAFGSRPLTSAARVTSAAAVEAVARSEYDMLDLE